LTALAETINNMTDTLATFADQVTTVGARSGRRQGRRRQANVPARGNLEGFDGQREPAGSRT